MILARIDPKDKEVTLVSIPRDTQIQLGTHGTQKINAAYAFGGPSGAIKAVEGLAVSTLTFNMRLTTRITWDISRLASKL